MSRIAYVNGRYLPHSQATIHIEDRGFQFADGVYEVIAVADGRRIDENFHLDRLQRSLGELQIPLPVSRRALGTIMGEVLRRNGIWDGILYMQITRGVAPRDHGFPDHATPSLTMTARRFHPPSGALLEHGARVVTIPDIRWKRNDIKSISLLPNVIGKQKARDEGAFEAWQIDSDGMVTEGTSTNAWIVTKEGELLTRPLSDAILAGITRRSVMALAREEGLTVIERPFSLSEAQSAKEAFVTSATSFVLPVTEIDDRVIGNGHPGRFTMVLLERYLEYVRS